MDSVTLTPAQTQFLAGRHFATVATLDDDGSPRQAVVWYRLEGDGRVAIAIPDRDDGLRWLGCTGAVDEVDEDLARARDDIVALAHRYSDDGTVDPDEEATFRSQQRITFRVRITGVHDHLED